MTVPAIPSFDIGAASDKAVAAQAHADTMRGSLLTVPVTRENMDWATSVAKGVRDYRKQLEAQRDAATKPLKGVIDTIRSWFADPVTACDEVYSYLTNGISTVVQAERIEQQRALAQAAATGAGPAEIARAVAAAAPKPSGTRETVYYSARVVDPDKVPARFRVIDMTAINAEARAAKDAFAVEGCELIKDVRVVPA